MEYQNSSNIGGHSNTASAIVCKPQRSLPIPREVNNFILKSYGALYYHSSNSNERIQILQAIEQQLKTAGYTITWQEVERRLKNMKSHYRRKQNDLRLGLSTSIDWEYYDALKAIFGPTENMMSPASSNTVESDDQKPEVKAAELSKPEKRKIKKESPPHLNPLPVDL